MQYLCPYNPCPDCINYITFWPNGFSHFESSRDSSDVNKDQNRTWAIAGLSGSYLHTIIQCLTHAFVFSLWRDFWLLRLLVSNLYVASSIWNRPLISSHVGIVYFSTRRDIGYVPATLGEPVRPTSAHHFAAADAEAHLWELTTRLEGTWEGSEGAESQSWFQHFHSTMDRPAMFVVSRLLFYLSLDNKELEEFYDKLALLSSISEVFLAFPIESCRSFTFGTTGFYWCMQGGPLCWLRFNATCFWASSGRTYRFWYILNRWHLFHL